MPSYIIEVDGIIKEAFSYAQPLVEASEYALGQYARANYSKAANVRKATADEEARMMLDGPKSLVGKPSIRNLP